MKIRLMEMSVHNQSAAVAVILPLQRWLSNTKHLAPVHRQIRWLLYTHMASGRSFLNNRKATLGISLCQGGPTSAVLLCGFFLLVSLACPVESCQASNGD